MKTIDSIIKNTKKVGKKVAVGVATLGAVAMFYGCQEPSDGGSKPPAIVNTAPVFGTHNCPSVVYENTTGECQLTATDAQGDPITYSTLDTSGAITVDATTGKVNWNAPEVSQDSLYNTTMKICDDKDACSTLDWEAEVKDVPVGENAKPIINSVDLYSPATFDGNNILVTWGKNFEGKINATDLEDDVIGYGVDATGDNLFLGYQNADAFRIDTTKPVSTDATHDLGQVVMEACDADCDTKILGVVGNHPIKLIKKEVFNENGTYGIISDATSDGSYLDRAELHVGEASSTKTFGDVYSGWADWEVVIGEGENNYTVKYFNDDSDERDIAGGFTPATEEEWRTIMRERLADWGGSYNEDYVVDFTAVGNPLCPVSGGTQIKGRVDFYGTENGWWTANYTDNVANIPAEYDLWKKINYCRVDPSNKRNLQVSLDPLYSAEPKGKGFVDNGFQVVE